MASQTHWRLALMFDALQGDIKMLEQRLRQGADAIRAATGGRPVRLGIADRHPDVVGQEDGAYETAVWRSVDGAVEVTLPNSQLDEIPHICRALRPQINELANIDSLEIMTGAIFSMVSSRDGVAFLSLAFRRYPGTTSAQFSDWWLNQHSKIAISVLGPGLLAYDQVHVEQAASALAAAAFGVPPSAYAAYDNLTWRDRDAFLSSCSDLEGMRAIAADEVGRIDDNSRRYALMRDVS